MMPASSNLFTRSDAMSQHAWTMPDRLAAGSLSVVGNVRPHNEDALLVDGGSGLFAVADGLGGHQAGERASHTAVEVLASVVREARRSGEPPRFEILLEAFERANKAILQEAHGDSELEGMGTTLTVLLAAGQVMLLGHVGDCRAWRVRDGEIEQLTQDHTVVGQQLRHGVLTPEEAEEHPMRHVLSRCLGVRGEVDVDLLEVDMAPEDVYVIASDGLLPGLDLAEMARVVRETRDPADAARRLVESACERDGGDNITAVVIRCREG